jgi:hypothetical protein
MEIFQEKLGYRVGYDEMDNRINKLSDEYKNIPTPPENCTNGQTLINQLYDYNIQIHELSGETAISNTGYTDYANKGQSLINSTQETNKKVKEFITSIGGTISN